MFPELFISLQIKLSLLPDDSCYFCFYLIPLVQCFGSTSSPHSLVLISFWSGNLSCSHCHIAPYTLFYSCLRRLLSQSSCLWYSFLSWDYYWFTSCSISHSRRLIKHLLCPSQKPHCMFLNPPDIFQFMCMGWEGRKWWYGPQTVCVSPSLLIFCCLFFFFFLSKDWVCQYALYFQFSFGYRIN